MGRLIGLVRPLIHIMAAAILLGVIGYLCAIFLTILAGGVLIHGISAAGTAAVSESIFLKTLPGAFCITASRHAITLLLLSCWR